MSDEKKRRQYDQFGEEGMKEQPGFDGFKFNFDDFFGDFGGGFSQGFGQKKQNSRHHGFKFSFDDIFNSNDQDEDEDSVFQAGNNGFGGFGFGDNLFSFGSESHTFTKTERRSSGKLLMSSSLGLRSSIKCQAGDCTGA